MISFYFLVRLAMPGLLVGPLGESPDDSASIVSVGLHLVLDWFAGPGLDSSADWLFQMDSGQGYASLRVGPLALTVGDGTGIEITL